MYEILSDRFVDSQDCPVSDLEGTQEITVPLHEQDRIGPAKADSFLDLLDELGRHPLSGDRGQVIAGYRAWIGRNSVASAALYAAWFNLGVELAGAGDKAGAIDAYRTVLALRPGFYPAAINLGTLMEAAGQPDVALATWQRGLQSEGDRAVLLDYRDWLAEGRRIKQQAMTAVLHLGCGARGRKKLPSVFLGSGWREIRIDKDPDVRPDLRAGLTDMQGISDGLADAVYSSDPVEHLYPHEVALALREMHRVLKPTGFVLIRLPDLQELARHVAEGRLEDALYVSPLGPITPLDMLYGHRPSLESGTAINAPRTGFTSATIAAALIKAGFGAAIVQRDPSTFSLTVIAFRSRPDGAQLAWARTQMLPAADYPAVLYTQAG
jgi:methyltransferase family protein